MLKKLKNKKIKKQIGVICKNVDKENYTLEAIFSTASEDRHGDVVQQNWRLDRFKQNPVILNSHNYSDASEVVGRATDVRVVDGKLQGVIKFAVEQNPKARVIFDLYADGFLNAFSVGFRVLQFNERGEISESELLEVSAVSVPANAEALAKKKGFNIDLLKDYEEDHNEEDDPEQEDNDEESGEDDQPPEAGNGEDEPRGEDSEEEWEDTGEEEEGHAESEGGDNAEDEEDENQEPEDGEDGDSGGDDESEERKTLTVQDKRNILLRSVKSIIADIPCESNMVETRSARSVRARNKRLINKAIRELTKAKKLI